ncbi:inositol monophosphatase family protein, partial [Mycobacteroides abscessus subsp. abscessus]
MTYRDFLETALHATARGAGILASAHPGVVRKKGDRDLVTDADLEIQRQIIAHLSRATPGIEVLAEESAHQPDPATAERLWVLDPIDGTSNF